MSHSRSFIQLLRKTGLILLLTLTIIMLLHMTITLYLCTTFPSWHTGGSVFDAVLLVFLYYVIPLIALLFFYLIINQLAKLEAAHLHKKSKKHSPSTLTSNNPSNKSHSTQAKSKSKSKVKHNKKEPLKYDCYTPRIKAPHGPKN